MQRWWRKQKQKKKPKKTNELTGRAENRKGKMEKFGPVRLKGARKKWKKNK